MSRRPRVFAPGQRYGRLTVTALRDRGGQQVTVRCDCGAVRQVAPSNLVRGHTTTCGCRGGSRVPGTRLTDHPLYRIWQQMRARCASRAHPAYADYGGAGVQIDQRWAGSFTAFVDDIGPRPDGPGRWMVARIDPAGHYVPGNVAWRTASDVMRTRRRSTRQEVSA